MTVAPLDHIHISEREPDGSWEDCTWDSGLEWYRLVYDARKPATHAEAQLLRRASGEPATGGSNMSDLARGIKARYGTTIPARISGFSALKAALVPNKVAVIQGSMKAFGPLHRLSKYDRNFDGAHAVVLMNYGGKLLWCDPEAPKDADVPVVVTWDEVKQFVTAFAGSHVVGTIKRLPAPPPPTGGDMPALTSYLPGYTANIKPSSNVRSAPLINTTTKLYTTGAAKTPIVLIGTVKGDVDPVNSSDVWYVWWSTTSKRYEYTAKDNVLDLKAPAAAPAPVDCAPAIKAAVDKAKADAAVEKDAAVAAAKTEATEAEQARISAVLGL